MAVSRAEAEEQLTCVRAHIEELRRAGRDREAAAVQFAEEMAERALRQQGAAVVRELLTTRQAALALGLSDQTIRNWVATDRLSAVQHGARTMIPRTVVEAEIDRSRIGEPEPSSMADPGKMKEARQALLAAIPPEITSRLRDLHSLMEDEKELSPAERSEMIRLERAMATAAARGLEQSIRRASHRTK